MKRLACAIAGLGRIASLLEDDRLREKPATHAGAITRRRDCVLVGGADPDAGRRQAFARRWRCGAVFASVEEMIEATHPDIVAVASPPDTHLAVVQAAVLGGARAVICEKPLAASLEEARAIAALHAAGPARILTNHERRYSRDYQRARRLVAARRHGPLLAVGCRLYLGRTRSAAEILLHDGTHMADIAAFLAGAPLSVTGASLRSIASEPAPAEALTITALARDVPVLMEVASGRDHVVFELDLSFSAGRLRIGNGLYEELRSAPSPYYEGMRSLRRLAARRPRVTGYFSGMMADAVACARDPSREPASSAADGLAALAFVHAALRAGGAGSLDGSADPARAD